MTAIHGMWSHWSDTTSVGVLRNGKYEVSQWITPPWQQLYWTPEFAEQVRVEKEEIARKNIECPPTFRFASMTVAELIAELQKMPETLYGSFHALPASTKSTNSTSPRCNFS